MMDFEKPFSLTKAVRKGETKLNRREIKNQETVETVQKIKEIKQRIVQLLEKRSFSPESQGARLRTLKILSEGRELVHQDHDLPISQSGVRRAIYEQGNETRVAYVKSQKQEPYFRLDEDGDVALITNHWDSEKQSLTETIEIAQDSLESQALKVNIQRRPIIIALAARGYGINIEEVPLPKDTVTMREGVEPGNSALRETIVADIDLIAGLETAPITTARADDLTEDVLSVQEGIVNQHEQPPPHGLTHELITAINKQGKEHPGAQSFMRIACLDYLVKSNDRHINNILWNPTTKTFHAIDNGFSLGLSRAKSETDPTLEPITPFRSAAMELIQKKNDPTWLLDDEATARLKYVYEAMQKYLQIQEDLARLPSSEREPLSRKLIRNEKGGEAECIVDLFRLLFKNERIADAEIKMFCERLKYLIEHRRPPILKMLSAQSTSGNTLATVFEE